MRTEWNQGVRLNQRFMCRSSKRLSVLLQSSFEPWHVYAISCLVAYSLAQRKREIGIRMALGADRTVLMRLLLRRGLTLTATGTLTGIVAGRVASRTLQAVLSGVAPNDSWTLFAAAGLMATVSLTACYLPVRRAVRLDPAMVFREG